MAKELAGYKLDLVVCKRLGGQDRHRTRRELHFFSGQGNKSHQLGTGLFVHHRVVIVVKGVEFVGERLKYIVLTGCRRDIIFLNGHAQTEVKGDDSKDSFCEEFE